jgi:hypothetical protein
MAVFTNHFSNRLRQVHSLGEPIVCRHDCGPTRWLSSLPIAAVHEHIGTGRTEFGGAVIQSSYSGSTDLTRAAAAVPIRARS